jgi:hypothetical protein
MKRYHKGGQALRSEITISEITISEITINETWDFTPAEPHARDDHLRPTGSGVDWLHARALVP